MSFKGRVYKVVDDENAPNRISVAIDKFWAWLTLGFVSVTFESYLQSKIDLKQPSGDTTLDIKGYGINKGQVASNANWELAFQRAFQDFLENLDKALDAKGL